eukprot:7670911-Pyramimonas_sp.AAC.1
MRDTAPAVARRLAVNVLRINPQRATNQANLAWLTRNCSHTLSDTLNSAACCSRLQNHVATGCFGRAAEFLQPTARNAYGQVSRSLNQGLANGYPPSQTTWIPPSASVSTSLQTCWQTHVHLHECFSRNGLSTVLLPQPTHSCVSKHFFTTQVHHSRKSSGVDKTSRGKHA